MPAQFPCGQRLKVPTNDPAIVRPDDLMVEIDDAFAEVLPSREWPRLSSRDETLPDEVTEHGAPEELDELHPVGVPVAVFIREKQARAAVRLHVVVRVTGNPATCLAESWNPTRVRPRELDLDLVAVQDALTVHEGEDTRHDDVVAALEEVQFGIFDREAFTQQPEHLRILTLPRLSTHRTKASRAW